MTEKLASLSDFMKRLAPPPILRKRDGRFKPKPKAEQSNDRA
jgi:hypothetical protein